MVYAGFWHRFGAYWADALILCPTYILFFWGTNHFRLFSEYYLVPGVVIQLFYYVYLVRRFEGTPGKRLMEIKIKRLDGTPIGYREAMLRYAPELILGMCSSIALIVTVLGLTDAQYFAASSFWEKAKLVQQTEPAWANYLTWASNIWVWSEFVVLLTNKKRRALQDFVAGTVVVCDDSVQQDT